MQIGIDVGATKIELNKETKLYFDLTQVSLFDANTQERL
jgi:hypothetical protein